MIEAYDCSVHSKDYLIYSSPPFQLLQYTCMKLVAKSMPYWRCPLLYNCMRCVCSNGRHHCYSFISLLKLHLYISKSVHYNLCCDSHVLRFRRPVSDKEWTAVRRQANSRHSKPVWLMVCAFLRIQLLVAFEAAPTSAIKEHFTEERLQTLYRNSSIVVTA